MFWCSSKILYVKNISQNFTNRDPSLKMFFFFRNWLSFHTVRTVYIYTEEMLFLPLAEYVCMLENSTRREEQTQWLWRRSPMCTYPMRCVFVRVLYSKTKRLCGPYWERCLTYIHLNQAFPFTLCFLFKSACKNEEKPELCAQPFSSSLFGISSLIGRETQPRAQYNKVSFNLGMKKANAFVFGFCKDFMQKVNPKA